MAMISDFPDKKGQCSICGDEIQSGGFWDGDITIRVCREQKCIESLMATVLDSIFDSGLNYHNPIENMAECGSTIRYWTAIFERVFWSKVSLEHYKKQSKSR